MQEIAIGISNMQCLLFIYGPNPRVKLCHDGWGHGFDLCDADRLGISVRGMPCVAIVITCGQLPGLALRLRSAAMLCSAICYIHSDVSEVYAFPSRYRM
jgi:hypothetical protein